MTQIQLVSGASRGSLLPRIRNESADGSRFCQPGQGVATVVSGMGPDVRRAHPATNKSTPGDEDRPDAQVGFFVHPGARTSTFTHHVTPHRRSLPPHSPGESRPPSLEQPRHVVRALHGAPNAVNQATRACLAARERRDAFFAHLAAETASGRTSAPPRVAVAVKQRFVLRKPDFLFDLPPPCGGLRSLSVGAGCLATKSRALS